MAGRNKIPKKLKALRGTKRKDRDNPAEPSPPLVSAASNCPFPLFGVALQAWDSLSVELTKIKVLCGGSGERSFGSTHRGGLAGIKITL